MSEQQEDADYMDEYDMEEEDMDDDFSGSDSDDDEYDSEDDFENFRTEDDTSAAQDIQDIPWDMMTITRETYRQIRLEEYKNFKNVPHSSKEAEKDCKSTEKGGVFYNFRQNARSVESIFLHLQLRNLVWATSKHDVYFMSHFSVKHFSTLHSNQYEVLNVSGHVAPREKHPGSHLEGFTQTQLSTIAVKDNLLVAGGFDGELICKSVDKEGVSFCYRTTYEDDAIINAVDIFTNPSGALHFTAACNDCGVRVFDMERFEMTRNLHYPWPVNHTSLSPDGRLMVIVGDCQEGFLVDSQSDKKVANFSGHRDFSFASAWNPDGMSFATGNQDKTCRVWDIRNLTQSVHALKGNIGAIRSIRYTSDGRFMSMAESADFVHIFDVKSGYKREQEIDFFGEITGIAFSPDTESLFIGVLDRYFGSLLEFGRKRNYSYIDTIV